MDKIQELEERLNRLEMRLKSNFLEIEKRFSEVPGQTSLPEDINERFNELEDLILLLQVDNTKIKEQFTGNLSFGADVDTASINERINILDEKISEISTAAEPALPEDLMEKINRVDEYINNMNEIKERLDRLEMGRERFAPKIAGREEEEPILLPSKNLLSEVNKILKGG